MLPKLSAWLRPNPRPRRSRQQQMVETLESRTLLAGNVTAVVEDGDLRITGDAEDNLVDVMVVNGDIVVQGVDGTTVNGSSDPFVAFAGTTTIAGDLEARLRGGDDTLRLFGPLTVAGRTSVRDHRGVTRLGITDVTFARDVRVTTGRGADEVSIAGSTFARDLRINADGGDNLVSIFESTVEDRTSISAGTTDGHCGWSWGRHHRHGWGRHRGGWGEWGWRNDRSGGDSQVVIEQSTLNHLQVSTGRGDDNVVLRETTVQGRIRGWTGSGDDFVMTDQVTVNGRTKLDLGRGDDALVTQQTNTFDGRVHASGGRGNDAQQISAETVFNDSSTLKRFESTTVDEQTIETRGLATLAAATDLRSMLNAANGSAVEEIFELV
jgi:hypothetical protein